MAMRCAIAQTFHRRNGICVGRNKWQHCWIQRLSGEISDRSKELYFEKKTVGQYLYDRLRQNIHSGLKNQVFYRQDYLDEFERIWETQAKYHQELTPELKAEIRDTIIFYQRRLKSQKHLISFCEFESEEREFVIDGKTKTRRIGSKNDS